jgi:hypothetical protein
LIECVVTGTDHGAYQVKVQDQNWAGTWMVARPNLTREIDDSGFPDC